MADKLQSKPWLAVQKDNWPSQSLLLASGIMLFHRFTIWEPQGNTFTAVWYWSSDTFGQINNKYYILYIFLDPCKVYNLKMPHPNGNVIHITFKDLFLQLQWFHPCDKIMLSSSEIRFSRHAFSFECNMAVTVWWTLTAAGVAAQIQCANPCLSAFQTPEREPRAAARRRERGHPLRLPSASAQTLHRLHPQPHRGQQGNTRHWHTHLDANRLQCGC